MLAASLANKVDLTLSLTIASEIVRILGKGMGEDLLLRSTIIFAALLAFLGRAFHKGEEKRPSDAGVVRVGELVMSFIALARRLTVLVFVQLALDQIQYKSGRKATDIFTDEFRGHGRSGIAGGKLPFSLAPIAEAFVVSSVAIVAATFAARMVSRASRGGVAELDRLLYSIQYMFADTVAVFFIDERIKYVSAFAGGIFIGKLTHLMSIDQSTYSASQVSDGSGPSG